MSIMIMTEKQELENIFKNHPSGLFTFEAAAMMGKVPSDINTPMLQLRNSGILIYMGERKIRNDLDSIPRSGKMYVHIDHYKKPVGLDFLEEDDTTDENDSLKENDIMTNNTRNVAEIELGIETARNAFDKLGIPSDQILVDNHSQVVISADKHTAAKLLSLSTGNRIESERDIRKYCKLMNEGDFYQSYVTIDSCGVFSDGHHRMKALALTNVGVRVLFTITMGTDANATVNMDTGKRRDSLGAMESELSKRHGLSGKKNKDMTAFIKSAFDVYIQTEQNKTVRFTGFKAEFATDIVDFFNGVGGMAVFGPAYTVYLEAINKEAFSKIKHIRVVKSMFAFLSVVNMKTFVSLVDKMGTGKSPVVSYIDKVWSNQNTKQTAKEAEIFPVLCLAVASLHDSDVKWPTKKYLEETPYKELHKLNFLIK